MYQVLLVDDETSVTSSLEQWIPWKQFNMEVAAIASSGEEALKIVQTKLIHMVLTDIRMQGLGGLELCQQLHRDYPHIQILIMSGYAEFSYAQRAFKYGILGYCLKPLEYDELCMYLNRALSRLRSEEAHLSQDDFLYALLDENISNIKQFLSSANFLHPDFYISVSTSDTSLTNENGLTIRLGRRQYAYLSPTPIKEDAIWKFTHKSPKQCFGILPTKVSAEELPAKIKECQALAWQYFINPSCRICSFVNEDYANNIVKKINSFLPPHKLIGLLESIKNDPEVSVKLV